MPIVVSAHLIVVGVGLELMVRRGHCTPVILELLLILASTRRILVKVLEVWRTELLLLLGIHEHLLLLLELHLLLLLVLSINVSILLFMLVCVKAVFSRWHICLLL